MAHARSSRARALVHAGVRRWRAAPLDFRWFLGALCVSALGGAIVNPAFNNYLRETFQLAADARGQLEFPRELPGFLVALTSGLLFFLPEVRTAAVSVGLTALGIAGLAWAGSQYWVMIAFMVLWSTGQHLMMPMRSSITLSFVRDGKDATLLGQTGAITTAAAVLGSGIGWWIFATFERDAQLYNSAFLVGAAVTALGALMLTRMRVASVETRQPRPKLVVRRRYRVYYLLSIIFGARKQIFITFAPWVLITIFDRGPSTFAALSVAASLIGLVLLPLLGRVIDRVGERVVLMADGVILFFVCVGYGFAHRIGTGGSILAIIYACYILDQLLFAVGMARTTYIKKIAERPEDVTASLSLGVTLDHIASMSIPALGGATWMLFGFEYVFVGAAGLALLSVVAASFVRVPEGEVRVAPPVPLP